MFKSHEQVSEIPCYRRSLHNQDRVLTEKEKYAARPPTSFCFRRQVLIMLGLMVVLSSIITYTYSYFDDSIENSGNNFQAVHIRDYLTASPGKAKSTYPAVGEPSGEVRPVAFYDENGELFLDFGEVVSGSSRSFHDVLRFDNISSKPLAVFWRIEGEIGQYMDEVEGNFILLPEGEVLPDKGITDVSFNPLLANGSAPDGTVNLGVYQTVSPPTLEAGYRKEYPGLPEFNNPFSLKLDINVTGSPGVYDGYLIIKVNGKFLSMKIPARVTVREGNKRNLPYGGQQNESQGALSENPDQQQSVTNETMASVGETGQQPESEPVTPPSSQPEAPEHQINVEKGPDTEDSIPVSSPEPASERERFEEISPVIPD